MSVSAVPGDARRTDPYRRGLAVAIALSFALHAVAVVALAHAPSGKSRRAARPPSISGRLVDASTLPPMPKPAKAKPKSAPKVASIPKPEPKKIPPKKAKPKPKPKKVAKKPKPKPKPKPERTYGDTQGLIDKFRRASEGEPEPAEATGAGLGTGDGDEGGL